MYIFSHCGMPGLGLCGALIDFTFSWGNRQWVSMKINKERWGQKGQLLWRALGWCSGHFCAGEETRPLWKRDSEVKTCTPQASSNHAIPMFFLPLWHLPQGHGVIRVQFLGVSSGLQASCIQKMDLNVPILKWGTVKWLFCLPEREVQRWMGLCCSKLFVYFMSYTTVLYGKMGRVYLGIDSVQWTCMCSWALSMFTFTSWNPQTHSVMLLLFPF